MNEPPDAEREPDGYIRLPWPLVAGGLFVLLAALFAFGLFANRNLRPQVGIVPTPSPVAVETFTTAPVAVPVPLQDSTPLVATPTSLVRSTDAALPTATAVPASTQTPVPLAQATASPLPTVDPALADEVGNAYVRFWQVRSRALLELDTAHLSEVMDGDYLANVTQRIDELRIEGRAIKTQVVLNYSVLKATNDSASVVDDFEDNSIYVKIGTEEPLSDPTADQLRVLYELHNISGAWKVVDSVRGE